MKRKPNPKRGARGQGLVEYALILVLVAVVVIVVGFALGLAVQRGYGLIAGGLGAQENVTADNRSIRITAARCLTSGSMTGIVVKMVLQNIPTPNNDLIVHTTRTAGTAWDSDNDGTLEVANFSFDGSQWLWNPTISLSAADLGLCPGAVMITTKDGKVVSVSPVKIG